MDGHLGLSMEVILVGHIDGSVCCIEILDSTTLNIQEIERASRKNGKGVNKLFSFIFLINNVIKH